MFFIFILLTCTTVTTLNLVHSLPIVDKGVFVITGVKTCGGGGGYCVLGQDCSVDKEFIADSNEGHCDGLRKAFTPRAFFVCCEYVDLALQTTTTTTTTTTQGSTLDPAINSDESAPENDDSAQSPESKESTSVESSESSDDNKTNKTTTTSTTITTQTEVTTPPPTTTTLGTSKPAFVTNIVGGDQVFDDNAVGQELDTTTPKINEITQSLLPNNITNFNIVSGVVENEDKTTVPVVVINGVLSDGNVHNHNILNVHHDDIPATNNEEEPSQIDTALNDSKVTLILPPTSTSISTSDNVVVQTTTLSSLLLSGGQQSPSSSSSSSGGDESGILQNVGGGGLQDGIPVETTTPQGVREKEHATTTVVSYSEKTEISMEQSVSLHVAQKQCGVKLSTSPRLDSPRLATATQSSSGAAQSCWTGAIVRSPTALSMQADPGAFICTGALIHPSVLLTTATCVSRLFSQDLSLFKVALGSNRLLHPLSGPTPDADYRDIKSLVIHEDYAVDGHLRINDIALVMLSDPADMSRTCTLCLPDEDADFTGRECSVTGYSHPSDSSTMESDGLLHEADQRVLTSSCTNLQKLSFRTEKDLHGLLCASGKYSAEACFSPRDAGSPLACSQNGINFLVGSFSSGFHCGNELMPVLYTSIVNYVGWINKNLIKTVGVF